MATRDKATISRQTLVDQLTGEMLAFLAAEGVAVGDRLPSLTALAERFGVATPTVREMARRLESIGVLSIRHGSGIYLARNPGRLMISNPSHAPIGAETVVEVLETRLLIEPELARRAAKLSMEEDLVILEKVMQDAQALVEVGSERELNDLNMEFHILVAHLAGNRVLAEAVQSVIELHMEEQSLIGRLYEDMRRDHDEHQQIMQAIRARDPAEAGRLMTAHLQEVLGVVRSRIENEPKESEE